MYCISPLHPRACCTMVSFLYNVQYIHSIEHASCLNTWLNQLTVQKAVSFLIAPLARLENAKSQGQFTMQCYTIRYGTFMSKLVGA